MGGGDGGKPFPCHNDGVIRLQREVMTITSVGAEDEAFSKAKRQLVMGAGRREVSKR